MVEYCYKFTYGIEDEKSMVSGKKAGTPKKASVQKNASGSNNQRPTTRRSASSANTSAKPLSRLVSAANDDQHKGVANRGEAGTATTTPVDSDLVLHAKVFAAAVKYQVPGLETVATRKFASAIAEEWDSPSLAVAIGIVYKSTPEETTTLREMITDILLEHDTLSDKPEIEAAIYSINSLMFQLYKREKERKADRAQHSAAATTILDTLKAEACEALDYRKLRNIFTSSGHGSKADFDNAAEELESEELIEWDPLCLVYKISSKKRKRA